MECKKCGNSLDESERICSKCGTKNVNMDDKKNRSEIFGILSILILFVTVFAPYGVMIWGLISVSFGIYAIRGAIYLKKKDGKFGWGIGLGIIGIVLSVWIVHLVISNPYWG